ncbi:MAG TPA: HDIG domain-containing protein [Myxococcaceae bacterium]|nr:HDIG domain-containing protein [Myxococcaceae bacterium]
MLARLKLPPDWRTRWPNAALLVAFSVVAGFVISPGLSGQQIPELKPEEVGRPFRSAPNGFKATRDYEIADNALTEQHRQEARTAVPTVYDYNPQVAREVRLAIKEAFAEMREASAAPVDEGQPKKRHSAEAEKAEVDARMRAGRPRFQERLFGRTTEPPLDDVDFEALVSARFSPPLEQAALSLVDHAYQAQTLVASSREELNREGTHGIAVRDLAGFSEQEHPVNAPSVMDVREAQVDLDRFAVPANVLPDQPGLLRQAVLRLVKRQLRPNLTINLAETTARRQRAADSVKEAVIPIRKGQKVIGDGELITETHLVILSGMRAQTQQLDRFGLELGAMGLVAVLAFASFAFNRSAFRRFRPTRRDAVFLGTTLWAMLALIRLGVNVADAIQDRYADIPIEALYAVIPVAAGAMLVRFILSDSAALFFTVVISALAGIMMGSSLAFGIYAMVGSLVASERIPRAKDRVGIFRAGVETGVVNALTVLVLALAEGKGFSGDTVLSAAFALVGTSVGLPMVVMAATPMIEAAFGYASDIKLLELANLNHPALKELIVQAPGTYHHSIILGTLVENAAEAIGANPLLARSCAYYHDIGKGKNPLYFGENQKGENKHEALAPAMSAVIIKRHVTEGMEMARQYRLPKAVADAIPQHHGTRLVGYFFHKAVKEQEGKENPVPVDESVYRYAGPKPQFKESALVMIADAVEASCRAMPEPTTPRLQTQVQKIINLIFAEGQLDECDLTLKDLTLIAQSFLHTLEGIYHARPQYPAGALGPGARAQGPVAMANPVPAAGATPPQPMPAAASSPKKSAGA